MVVDDDRWCVAHRCFRRRPQRCARPQRILTMAGYHVVLVHFPIALFMTATLAILLRAISDGPLAKATDRALVPLLAVGLVVGVASYVVGLLVWPWEAIASSPLGRNHMLLATWTLTYWALMLAT